MQKTENFALPQWEASDGLKREDFNKVMETVDTALAECRFVISSYTGNGLTMDECGLTVELGFQPRFLIISRGWSTVANMDCYFMLAGEKRSGISSDILMLRNTGFAVAVAVVSGSFDDYVRLNEKNTAYSYIAFR